VLHDKNTPRGRPQQPHSGAVDDHGRGRVRVALAGAGGPDDHALHVRREAAEE